MSANVIGPMRDRRNAANAAKRLAEGATVVVWDEDGEALRRAVEGLPATPPGRLCTWVGSGDDEGLRVFIEEVLDPTVK